MFTGLTSVSTELTLSCSTIWSLLSLLYILGYFGALKQPSLALNSPTVKFPHNPNVGKTIQSTVF